MDPNYYNEKEKYYIDSQKYSECQLITAINATIYLNELPIIQGSIEYERLVDLVCAKSGPAINIDLAHKYLRIVPTEMVFSWINITHHLDKYQPVEITVYHKKFGLHSMLIIDYKTKPRRIKALNFGRETDRKCYLKWSRLRQLIVKPTIRTTRKCAYYSLNSWYVRKLQIENNTKILNSSITYRTGDL